MTDTINQPARSSCHTRKVGNFVPLRPRYDLAKILKHTVSVTRTLCLWGDVCLIDEQIKTFRSYQGQRRVQGSKMLN